MKLQTRNYNGSIYLIGILLAAAYLLRILSYMDILPAFAGILRSIFHVCAFALWGISVKRRVIQPNVQLYMVSTAALMVMWILFKALKYYVIWDQTVSRYLWYLYYGPMLFIPALALMTAFMIGRPSDYRFPRKYALIPVVTAVLFLSVLTNDFHRLAFSFEGAYGLWDNNVYDRGILYLYCVLWMLVCGIASIVVLTARSRFSGSSRLCLIPLIPLALASLYTVVSLLELSFVKPLMGDFSMVYCILFMAVLESCLRCGLIPCNVMYEELFRSSVNMSAQITDNEYNIRYSSMDACPVPRELMERAADSTVFTEDGRQVQNMAINGGHVIWLEDHRELFTLKNRLQDTHDELEVRNALLKLEYEKDKEYITLQEKNRLYDLLHGSVIGQLDMINSLVSDYETAEDQGTKSRILSELLFIGAYIKRRKDLTLSADSASSLHIGKLKSALLESLKAMERLGIRVSLFIYRDDDYIPASRMLEAYDFFETIAEDALDEAKYFTVRISPVKGILRVSIFKDHRGNLEKFISRFPDMFADIDSDGTSVVLPLKGGESR